MMYTFGSGLRFTLYGKSHGPCVGAILEGLPMGLTVDMDSVMREMELRKPRGKLGTPRRESDVPRFLEGIDGGMTTGERIVIEIANKDTDGSKYEKFYDTPRPGHADLPALLKFPDHDLRGSGQFSGRLTAAMVAAGAIAKQSIGAEGIAVEGYTSSVGDVVDSVARTAAEAHGSRDRATRACTAELDEEMRRYIESAGAEGDSVGGTVDCIITGLPIGFGGIWFDALDAQLALAVFGIPACKGVEFGDGFGLARMKGSQSNDPYRFDGGRIVTGSNHLGGIVGGMADGAEVRFSAVFKPTPSIAKEQDTVSLSQCKDAKVTVEGRHDPCIVPRAVAAVEAMAAITIADQMLRGFRWVWRKSGRRSRTRTSPSWN